jgi:hypothetical protein
MKIRSGFVSNSSSSSFIILGKKISLNEFIKHRKPDILKIRGSYLYEAYDLIERDIPKIQKLFSVVFDYNDKCNLLNKGSSITEVAEVCNLRLQKHIVDISTECFCFYEAYKTIYEDDEKILVKKEELPDEFNVYHINVDQHSHNNIFDFYHEYIIIDGERLKDKTGE